MGLSMGFYWFVSRYDFIRENSIMDDIRIIVCSFVGAGVLLYLWDRFVCKL